MSLQDILINEDNTMLEAMEGLDRVARKVLFVERDGILIASVTDGDIRRWILSKGNLDAKVRDLANYNPKFIEEKDKAGGKNLFKEFAVEALPIVDKNQKIISVIFRNDSVIEPQRSLSLPVVIMAGGFGTRLYPYTKILPKPLIPIGDVPIVEHIINRFRAYGCKQFYLVVNHKKNMIKAYFNEIEKDYDIVYIDEEKPLGTGGGLSLLKGKITSPFILSNCDILVEDDYEKMYKFHVQTNHLITMVCTLKNFTIPYGVVEFNECGHIESMREKPEMSFFTNTGLYIVEPKVIEELEEGCFIGFPTIIEKYIKDGESIGVYPISERSWMDMGQLEEMELMMDRLKCNG